MTENIIPQSKRLSQKCPINLLSHQKEHVKNIWEYLVMRKEFSYIDTSQTGLGKTFVTLYIAWHLQQLYGTQIVVIGPSHEALNNDDGWVVHAKKYGINILYAFPYSTLRGNKGKLSHGLLSVDANDKKIFHATSEFLSICSKGLFLIFDEFHHAKNASLTHYASTTLIKTATLHHKSCRVALLSHTPADKVEAYPRLLRMTGIVTENKFFQYVPATGEYRWIDYGLGELVRFCISKNGTHIEDINNLTNNITKSTLTYICKTLYDKYIKNKITFAMIPPESENETFLENRFFNTDSESTKLLEQALAMLEKATSKSATDLAGVTQSLRLLERGKLGIIAKYVNKEIKKFPNKKFILCCGSHCVEHHKILQKMIYRKIGMENYSEVISDLRKYHPLWKKLPKDLIGLIFSKMGNEHPIILNGSVSKEERIKIIGDFQSDTPLNWCLIMSPSIGSESISLHDKFGNRPREMLIVPTYYWTQIVQASGRIIRTGRKSTAKVIMVYSKQVDRELKILDTLVRKSIIGKDLIKNGQKVTYPGDYPQIVE